MKTVEGEVKPCVEVTFCCPNCGTPQSDIYPMDETHFTWECFECEEEFSVQWDS